MVQTPYTHRLTHTHVHTGCGYLYLTQTSVVAVCPKGMPFSEACHPGPRTEPESPERRSLLSSFGKPQVAVVDPDLEPDSWKGTVFVAAGRPGSGELVQSCHSQSRRAWAWCGCHPHLGRSRTSCLRKPSILSLAASCGASPGFVSVL